MLIDGEEWDTTGLPAHMLRDIPRQVQVTVTQQRHVFAVDFANRRDRSVHSLRHEMTETYTEVLERDGKPLKMSDAAVLRRGEADGWKPRRIPHPFDMVYDIETGKYNRPMATETPEMIDVECEVCDE